MSDWYSAASVPAFRAKAVSATIRNEFAAVETAMGKLPTLTGNGSKLVAVNSGGTALEAVTNVSVAQGGTGATTAAAARTALGLAIGTDVQAYNAKLAAIVALSATDGGFIVGDGATFVEESGATARASLGLVIGTDVQAYNAKLAAIAAITPTDGVILVGDGATFVSESGATARTSLGLTIGTDVQAYNANLATISGLGVTDGGFIVGNGTAFVLETGATVRTSLGLAIGTDVVAWTAALDQLGAIGAPGASGRFIVSTGASSWGVQTAGSTRSTLGLSMADSPTFAGLTLSSPLSVANGGTGASSLTAGCVLLGSGTGAITALDVTAKGALLVGDGTGDPRALLAGADGYVLTLDSAQTVGMKWAAVTSGTVTSVSGGTGLTGTVTTTGSLNLDISGLTAVEVDALIASDGILIDDGGTMKRMRIDDMGTIVQSAATQTLATTDNNSIIYNSGASTYTITAPSDATAAIPVGGQIGLMCSGTGRLTVAAGSGATVTSLNSNLSVKASGGAAVLVKVSTNGWMLVGDLEAT